MNGNEISELLERYGTSLEETRKLLPKLTAAIAKERVLKPPAFPQMPKFFTAEEVAGLGLITETGEPFTIEEGWMLKLTPGKDGVEPSISFITPDKWEILEDQTYISPEGQRFTQEELLGMPEVPEAFRYGAQEFERWTGKEISPEEYMQAFAQLQQLSDEDLEAFYAQLTEVGRTPETEAILRELGATDEQITEFFGVVPPIDLASMRLDTEGLEGLIGKVFIGLKPDKMIEFARNDPQAFLGEIVKRGRSRDTEDLLQALFPEVERADLIQAFFPETAPMSMTEMALKVWGETPWRAEPAEWSEAVKGFPGLMDIMQWLAPTKAGAALGVFASHLQKYVMTPWETMILDARARFQIGIGLGTNADREFLKTHYGIIRKYGYPACFFADEYHEAFQVYLRATPQPLRGAISFTEWLNPVWFIPIGGTFGRVAQFTSKVPVIGKNMARLAAGVQATERGIIKPVELTARGIQRAGAGLSEATINQLIKRSEHLVAIEDLAKLNTEEILSKLLAGNWMQRVLARVSKIPPIGKVVEWGLGKRFIITREGKLVEDVVGRASILQNYFDRIGVNARAPIIQSLRAIESNPVKYFGFNEQAFSNRMLRRLLPEFRGTANAGTLEHVFTHPTMYNWRGMERGLEYVARVNEINRRVLNALKAEGVAPEHVVEDWIHRVVVSEGRRLGRGGRAIGARQPFERVRKFETMADGIEWFRKHPELGAHYANNPEISVGAFAEEAFRKIGSARAAKYLEPFGITPTQRLAERFPEVVERALLTQTELADAAKFHSVINRAIRGEKIPEQTLRAMEKRFPELGTRLRALTQEPLVAERQLRELLAQNQKLINDLTRRLKKAEAIDVESIRARAIAEARAGIPDEYKLREAFEVMDYEDRLAFRSTMQKQVAEVERVSAEQGFELQGIKEWLETDAVANFTGQIGKRRVHLTYFIKHGDFPESFTLKEAAMLMQKRMEDIQTRVIRGGVRTNRVPREVVLDNLAEHFGMTEQQLIDHIAFIAERQTTLRDLEFLVGMANERFQAIRRMLSILDDVETKPRLIPKAEPGMPEAGVQQDIFGYEAPVFPRGRGQVTQLSMDDYTKLVEAWKKAGLPEDALPVGIRPKIEGVPGLEGAAGIGKVSFELPPVKSAAQREVALKALRNEIKALVEKRKAPYWQARAERAFKMEQIKQPGIQEGYILQPFAGGRIFSKEFVDAFNKFFGHESGLGVLKVTSDMAGILRITKAALDFSMMAIQGLPSWGLAHSYMLTNPAIGIRLMGSWYKAFGESIGIFFNRGILAQAINKKMAVALQRIQMGGSARAVDYFQALEARRGLGGLAERGMKRIPLEPYHRAEAAFFGAGEIIRNDFWEILYPLAKRHGTEFQLARSLDLMTGIADSAAMGVPLTVRQLEQSFMWFAPNYTRACLTLLAHIGRGGMTGAMARRALGGMMAAGPLYYSAVQYSISSLQGKSHEEAMNDVLEGFCVYQDPITKEWEWKPSARLMTLKIGNYNFGVGGFWYGLVRLSGNIMACVNEVGERERIDLIRILKHGSLNKQDNPFIYWWFSRASPFFGSGFEMATGKDFLGYPIETPAEYAKYIATRFEPIWMEQGLNWLIPGMARDNEIPEGIARMALAPAELFGLRTFPEGTWVRFYDMVKEYISRIPQDELDPKQVEAWREGKLEWRHLTEIQQMNLLSRYPELQELYEEAQADSAVRNSLHWQAWQGRMDEEKAIYYQRIDELTQRLLRGEIDTREYRELCGEAGQNYGYALEAIERDPHYAEIYEYFNKKEAEGEKYGFLDDVALGEYLSQIAYAEDLIDEKGDYDWDERDRRIDAFIEKWGLDTYERLQDYIAQKRGLAELNEVWIRKAQDTEKLGRTYWRLPYKPITEMDEEDEGEGNIPPEYLTLWKQYQTLTTEQKAEFIEAHPELAKDWRAEYRLEHPEDDARLALWGYSGKIQSMEAYNFLVQWSKELGIPLSQMGLGLPPHSLIEDYFDYNKLVIQFSGNSAEAKLWRLEHPDFTNWAMESWGWEGTEDYRGMEYYRLQIKWRDEQAEYDALTTRDARDEYLATHSEFRDDRRRLQAIEYEFSEDLIETYVIWYKVEKPEDYEYDLWYEDDWFLMEHPEFYLAMFEHGIWTEPRDFSTVPTRAVWNLYKTYLGLPKGQDRLDFRVKHPELDAWLIIKFGYTPASERGRKEAEKTVWEKAQEALRIKEWIESLFK